MKLNIREWRPEDAKPAYELFYDTVHRVNAGDYTKAQLDAWAPAAEPEGWQQSFAGHYALAAMLGEQLVGFGDISPEGLLDRLFVHWQYQGQGIGSAICAGLEQLTPGQITTQASLTARPFFSRRGYVEVRRQQVERRGVWLTNFVMVLAHLG